jgi:hypothetical protein
VPLVKLDDKYFKLVDQMERLTPRPPSLVAAKSLTVKVSFPLLCAFQQHAWFSPEQVFVVI